MIFAKLRGYKKVAKFSVSILPNDPVHKDLLDITHVYQKDDTAKNAHNLWSFINREWPEFKNNRANWYYNGITQIITVSEGHTKDRDEKYKWVKDA